MHLVLDHSVAEAGGAPLTGVVEIANTTGKPVTITDFCDGWIFIGLTNHTVRFSAAWFAVLCAPGELPVGTSRVPVSIATTYNECLEPGGSSLNPMPPCFGPQHDQGPPLPAGHYLTQAAIRGLPPEVQPPPAVTVTLVPPSRTAGANNVAAGTGQPGHH